MKSERLTYLFDADVLAYRFGNSGVVDLDFGDGDGAALTNADEAIERAVQHVAQVLEQLGDGPVILCWSDPGEWENFRLEVDCTYKWKRPGHTGRPPNYYAVRERMAADIGHVQSLWRPRLEADDVMGILATAPRDSNVRKHVLHNHETCIISVDKDMLQIPGHSYNPVTRKFTTTPPWLGGHIHMLQTLMGDPVDNYDGIPGIGKVKAEKILAPAEYDPVLEWELVVDAYVESNQFCHGDVIECGHPKKMDAGCVAEFQAYLAALQQARLAKILDWQHYDFNKKEPILWTPPTARS